ncbi:MAG TPA: PAS domain-containing protein, partial [Gemmata sp.]|nr:PAS domain-containing protein [Gemmata sp.]
MNHDQDCTAGAARTADPDAAPDLAHVRAVADQLPQLVWTCLPDGYCDYVSRRWVDYTGVPEAKHHGRGWLRAVHPADRGRTRAAWDAFVAGTGEYDVDYRLRRHDGAYRWFKTRGVLVRDGAGNPVRVFGTTTDVHAQKRAEEKLREAEERAAFVRRASGVGFWYCDLPFDVLEWDEQVKEHFHLPPDARVTIDTFYDRIHPDDRGPT